MRRKFKSIYLASASILAFSTFFKIQAHAVTYDELCQYDPIFCTRLRDGNGQSVKPLPEVVAVLKTLNPKIKEVAEQYGVDSRAVVGAILAENSLNVTKNRSQVKDFLYWAGLQGQYKKLTGHMPSLGLGQIQPNVAMGVEEMVAKKEGRPTRTVDQVAQALKDPVESLKYAAAIIRDGQDAYKSRGIDISNDPGLLTTVYNLGGAPTRAEEAKSQSRKPRVNFFGFFVNENLGSIDEIMNYTPPTKETVRPSPFLSGRGVDLLPYPPECDPVAHAGQHDYSRDKTYNKAEPVGSGAGFYKVVSHGVDCDMKPWSMIQTSNGKLGWVSDESLQAHTNNLPAGAVSCNKQAFESCRKQIQQSVSGLEEVGRDQSGALTFKINRKDKSEPANLRSWKMKCLSGELNANLPGKVRRGKRRGTSGYGDEIKASDVPKLREQIERKRAELVAKFGADVVDDKSSDLYNILHSDNLNKCGTLFRCSIDKKAYEEFLQSDISGAFSSYREAKTLGAKFGWALTYENSSTVPLKDAVVEIDEQCKGLFPDFPALQDKWTKYKKDNAKDINDPQSEIEVSQVSGTLYACMRIQDIRANSGGDKLSAACKNEALQAAVAEQSKASMSAIVRKWLSEKADQEDFLNDTLDWLNPNGSLNFGRGENLSCNYDPTALEKDVEKLAQNSCIDSVLVPDLSVVKKFTSQGSKQVSFSQFEDPDVYGVRIKGACDE